MGKCFSSSADSIHKKKPTTLEKLHVRRSNFRKQYTVRETLYQKSKTSILLVTDKTTGENRAIKSIQVSEKSLNSLLYEVQTLQKLDHPHIIKIFETYIEAENLHIVTEFCSGGELIDRISKRTNFNEHQASIYMQQITSALIYLHKSGIIHKDLKPENIIFADERENAPLRLMNFSKTRLNQESFLFKAPEGFSDEFVFKSDIWSLGVIFYLMLSGTLPFPESLSATDHFFWLQKNEISYEDKIWKTISPEAKDLLQKMLEKNPITRLSASGVYNHIWMEKFLENQKTARLSKKSLLKLSDYSRKSKFKRALLSYMVTKVSIKADVQKLIKVFKTADKDADGELTVDEIIECINKAEIAIDPLTIISAINANDKGLVTYSEFVTAFVDWTKELNLDRLKRVFSEMDLDGDGFISSREFAHALNNKYSDEEVKTLMTEADLNGDGLVDFSEFCKFFQ
jgi:calcium-dependent protein kinase